MTGKGQDMLDRYRIGAMPAQVAAERLELLRGVEPATVGHWRHWGFVDAGIARLRRGPPVLGTAVTVSIPGEDSTLLHHLLTLVRPGDFVFVDRLGDRRYACWGGGLTLAAREAGVAGAAIDGPATDIAEIEACDFHVWSRGLAPITTRLRDLGGAMNLPVAFGGAVVQPGDAVIADDNGILVLPPAEIESVAEAALARQARGAAREAEIRSGGKLGLLSGASAMVEGR